MIISKWRLRAAAICAMLALAAGTVGHAQTAPDGSPAPPGAVGGGGAPPAAPDPVVVAVDGQPIKLSEVSDEIHRLPGGMGAGAFASLYPVALERLVQREALILRAHAEGMGEDPDVLRHIQEAADRVLEDAYLQRATARRVSEEQLLQRYDREIRGKPGPEQVHAWAILVPTEAEASDLIARLAGGADFATLAKQVGQDAGTKLGGDLGFVQRDGLSPELGAVLFELRPDQVAPYPVRTPAGWFVVKVTARRQAPTPTFAEAHERLQAEAQREEVEAVVRTALEQAQVQTYDANGNITAAPGKNNGAGGAPNGQ